MSAELTDSMHHSLLTAKGFMFVAEREKRGKPWTVVVGDKAVGTEKLDNIKTWHGVEIFVRGAAAKLYNVAV